VISFCFIGLVFLVADETRADTITDLFDTGVDPSGAVLPKLTSSDPHYTIVYGTDDSAANSTILFASSSGYAPAPALKEIKFVTATPIKPR
jgi:hypothetical protein